jgi:hypothetical protein
MSHKSPDLETKSSSPMDYHSGLSIWTDDYYHPRLSARSDAAEALRIAEMRMYGGSCAAELSTAPTPLYAPTASVTSSLSSVAALNMPHRGLGGLGAPPHVSGVPPLYTHALGASSALPLGGGSVKLFGRAAAGAQQRDSSGADRVSEMPVEQLPVVQRCFYDLPAPEASTERPNRLYPRSGARGTPQGFPCVLLALARLLARGRAARRVSRRSVASRRYKLFEILSRPDQWGHIIRWSPSGRSFVVLDRAALMRDVLPRYMNQAEWTSFQRQLNNFGMRTVARQAHNNGEPPGAYVHPLFRRDRPDLLFNVRRKVQDRPSEAGKRPRKRKGAAASTPQASVGQLQIPVSPILPGPDVRADSPAPAPTSFDIGPQFVYPDGEAAAATSSDPGVEMYFEPLSPSTSKNWATPEEGGAY